MYAVLCPDPDPVGMYHAIWLNPAAARDSTMRTVAIAQARMGSTRLPGKVMFYLADKPVLQWVYDAIKAADGIDEVVIATSTLPQDDNIAKYCAMNRINCFRGSEADVLDRFYHCSVAYAADV